MEKRKELLKIGFWFYIFNTIPLLIIATRFLKYITGLDSFLDISYMSSATLSHFMSLSLVEFLIYIPFVLIFPNKKFAWIITGTISTVSLSLLTLDSFVFDIYRMHINSFVLELVFGGAANQIFSFHYKLRRM
ncbi:MAG: DUF3413 domain-containing protein, partial [Vicingaceae bacterium]|nr:DUF3413 domain-containing protein [Vicingaceae bacterium]